MAGIPKKTGTTPGTIAPATIFIVGDPRCVYEPLLLEALANHPACSRLIFIPVTTQVSRWNEHRSESDWLQYFRTHHDLPDEGVARVRQYAQDKARPEMLDAYDITAVLKRKGTAAPDANIIRTQLEQDYFPHHDPIQISTGEADLIINGSSDPVYSLYLQRRGHAIKLEDHVERCLVDQKTRFPDWCEELFAKTHIRVNAECKTVHNVSQARSFMDQHGYNQIALKTGPGHGGMGVFRLYRESQGAPLMAETARTTTDAEGKLTFQQSHEQLPENFAMPPEGLLAMRWLDNSKGDMRVLVYDGACIGAYVRHSHPETWKCNVHEGATIEEVDLKRDVTPADRKKMDAVAQYLKHTGVRRAALDWLADEKGERFLSEINIGITNGLDRLHGHEVGRRALQEGQSLAAQAAAGIMQTYAEHAEIDKLVESQAWHKA